MAGRELSKQLLERGDRVAATVRDKSKVADLLVRYPQTFRAELLDVTDTAAVNDVVGRSFAQLGPHRRDVIQISSYGGQVAFPGNSIYHDPANGLATITTLHKRIADFKAQRDLAASTDFPPEE